MINIEEYKGILFIIILIITIMYYSKDLEGVLLMTGIIINVIAICLNTGATKFKGNSSTEQKSNNLFLPPRRYDLIHEEKNKANFSHKPNYNSLNEEIIPSKKTKETEEPKITVVEKYKGAIDYEECPKEYNETATDNIPKLSLNRQGVNYRRQISGAMGRRKVLMPYIVDELIDEQDKIWWGADDY